MNLKPGIVLLTFIGYTYSVIMVGTFCRYKSVKRSFTPNKIVKATNVLECSVRCLSDGQCTRFNFNSRGNLSCEIGLAGNLTCSSLVKKNLVRWQNLIFWGNLVSADNRCFIV